MPKRILISEAVENYLADLTTRNVGPPTLRRCRWIFRECLVPWSEQSGLHYLDELTTPQLTQWRFSWQSLAPITILTRQQRVVNFFEFCVRQGWLDRNAARFLSRILVRHKPTEPFTREEFESLVKATYIIGQGSGNSDKKSWRVRLRTLLLLLRWSGVRISDGVTLERSRLVGASLLLHQAKTGIAVYIPLPPEFADALRQIPPGRNPNPRYFFWSGECSVRTAVRTGSCAFRTLFRFSG